jgi:hypothetical protein
MRPLAIRTPIPPKPSRPGADQTHEQARSLRQRESRSGVAVEHPRQFALRVFGFRRIAQIPSMQDYAESGCGRREMYRLLMYTRVFAAQGRKSPSQIGTRGRPKDKGGGRIAPRQHAVSSLVICTPAEQLEKRPGGIDMPSLPHNVQGLGCKHVVAVDTPDHECPSSFSLTHRSRLLVKVIDEAHPRIAQRQFLMQGVQLRIGPQPGLPRNPLPLQGRQGEPRKQPPPVLLESSAAINGPGSKRDVPSNAQDVLRVHVRILAEEPKIRAAPPWLEVSAFSADRTSSMLAS